MRTGRRVIRMTLERHAICHGNGVRNDAILGTRTGDNLAKGGVAMLVEVWEWAVMRDAGRNPVGVSMTCDRAKAALSRELESAGRPGRGSIRPMVLVDAVHSDTHYLRLPITNVAIYEQGTVRWEDPSHSERLRWSTGVVRRGGEVPCGV
jgi:hypothetical protein